MARLARMLTSLVTPPKLAFGGHAQPTPPSIPAPPPPPPMLQSPQGAAAADDARRRAAAASGYGGTIMTGPEGITTPATTSAKTLLGG